MPRLSNNPLLLPKWSTIRLLPRQLPPIYPALRSSPALPLVTTNPGPARWPPVNPALLPPLNVPYRGVPVSDETVQRVLSLSVKFSKWASSGP